MSSLKSNLTGNLLVGASRFFTGMRVRYTTELPSSPAIYYANHTSHLDGLAVWSSLPKSMRNKARPIAARDYWDSSKLKRYIANEVFNALLIDRKPETREEDPIEKMLSVLDQGDSLILFPEGTRGDGAQINQFKSGLFHLAQARPEIPLVPVYLHNLHRVLPKGSKLIVPILCKTIFGEPISFAQYRSSAFNSTVDESVDSVQIAEHQDEKSLFLARARAALEELKHVV